MVRGFATDEAAADRAYATAAAWGKSPVRCADTPGFIVNRVARPFYAEAFRVYEERAAAPATIDAALRESGGFKMGPFELTDLIGQDVNEAVTRSVWESFFQDPKFTPSLAQRRLVESGLHGRKSGRGWYDHGADATPPVPHTAEPRRAPREVTIGGSLGPAEELRELIEEAGVKVVREDAPADLVSQEGCVVLPGGARLLLCDGYTASDYDSTGTYIYFDLALDYRAATRIVLAPADSAAPEDMDEAIGLFQALGKRVSVIDDVPGMIVARTVAMIADFALDAVARGVAGPEDVDMAMRLGVNYPGGPLEWVGRLGAPWVEGILDRLHQEYHPTGRYAPSPALRRRAAAERRVL